MVPPHRKLKATSEKVSPARQWGFTLLLPCVGKPLKGGQQSYTLRQHIATPNYSCSGKLLRKIWSQYSSKATWAFPSVWKRHLSPVTNEKEATCTWSVKSRNYATATHLGYHSACSLFQTSFSEELYKWEWRAFKWRRRFLCSNTKTKCGSVTFSDWI